MENKKRSLKVLEFINKNLENWKELLSQPPYSLKINQDQEYYILSYDMIESDMSLEICQECRGLIIKEEIEHDINENRTIYIYTPVCVPFYKFFNYGEQNYKELKSENLKVQEKVDGSLIKMWFDGHWRVSTNGTISAASASLQFQTDKYKNYMDLFNAAWKNTEQAKWRGMYSEEILDKDCTYMFELVSPYNRIVVPYKDIKLYHLGTRNNKTLQEFECNINIEKPKTYNLNSIPEIIKAAKKLPFNEEGYVVVDENYDRVKIKSPAYVSVHYLRNQFNTINYRTILEIIFNNGQDDVLAIYPEYKEHFDLVQSRYKEYVDKIKNDIKEMDFRMVTEFNINFNINMDNLNLNIQEVQERERKKRFAKWAVTKSNSGILFKCYDYGTDGWEEKFLKVKNKDGEIEKSTLNKILNWIGLKGDE